MFLNPINKIGLPAVLEQCAEECTELAKVNLKMARKLRGENPTPKTMDKINQELIEEIADVLVCIDILLDEVVSRDDVTSVMLEKRFRWNERLTEN